MRQFQGLVAKLTALLILVSLLIASMFHPWTAWAFVIHVSILISLTVATVRGLFLSAGRNHAIHGFVIGGLLVIVIWVVPLPVAVIAGMLDIKGPFGDIMLMSIPFFGLVPLIGAGIGALVPCPPYSDADES